MTKKIKWILFCSISVLPSVVLAAKPDPGALKMLCKMDNPNACMDNINNFIKNVTEKKFDDALKQIPQLAFQSDGQTRL